MHKNGVHKYFLYCSSTIKVKITSATVASWCSPDGVFQFQLQLELISVWHNESLNCICMGFVKVIWFTLSSYKPYSRWISPTEMPVPVNVCVDGCMHVCAIQWHSVK